MTVKEKIAALLEKNKGTYLSGEDIASELGITRAAVWKSINSLKDNGYIIEAVTNKGYMLSPESDILSAGEIKGLLTNTDINIELLKTVTSTNTVLKEKAAKGALEGTVIIASQQTAGRGRFSRRFFSPDDSGIYMSILIRPDMSASDATLITTAAAVAVAKAAETLSGKQTGIKWVNDVLIDSKKICGILTEASLDIESGRLNYAVVGIGINAYSPVVGFPDEIKDIAGCIFDERSYGLRNKLAAEVINNFMSYYNFLMKKSFLDFYRSHCIVLGKKIFVLSNGNATPATALDIDGDCRLLVEYENGQKEYLSSGEISIKLG